MIWYVPLAVAAVGIITSTAFLLLAVVGAVQFRLNARKERKAFEKIYASLPPVSVLKPVHGNEARLKENLESFFNQRYPKYEILFAADEADDAALPVIREICARYPHIPTRILVTGAPPWPNAQNYCFHRMAEVAAHDILVTSDSDVEVDADYLRDVSAPLLDPGVGAVTCIFRGKSAGGVWAALDAMGQSVEFSAGVLIANLLEGTKFGLGPTIAVRKDSLARIGGFAAIRQYLSNDFALGNAIHMAGYKIVLSGRVVDHVSQPRTFRQMWERQLRWAMGTRYSRPKGHPGTVLTFAVPYGILALITAPFLGHPLLGVGLFAAAWLNRMVESLVIGWWAVGDRRALPTAPIYPVRDLLGFIVWCASYLSKRSLWRDNKYVLLKGGKLVARRADGAIINPE
ncbi:MAG TPA: bacteriohopanetetrol glucosamine biosynthesis glycosyltransferase HpnI [Acidobacteriaceae bacterium]|nr:bacteriohopanetetrol glucosamine biosynthesis glycosyltransferase HpnI [Acidobacteriaceae bacterium]